MTLPQGRLKSIDSLRGVAALSVLAYHLAHGGYIAKGPDAIQGIRDALFVLPASFGFTGVYLFFVISGFCIHLKAARMIARGEEPRIEFIPFWKRRFVRLYPAYIAALALYLGAQWHSGAVHLTPFFAWDVASHLLMLHNLDARTVYTISGVLWTLAIEEQLYLAYFVLLRLRSRYGWAVTLAVCAGARVAWFAMAWGASKAFGWRVPFIESAAGSWVIWALGALSVEWAVGAVSLRPAFASLRLSAIGLAACAAGAALHVVYPQGLYHLAAWFLLQPMWGLAYFLMLNAAVKFEARWSQAGGLPAAASVLVSMGTISYSLYLTHDFVLAALPGSGWLKLAASLAFAAAFYSLFERPFMPSGGSSVPARDASLAGAA